MLYALLLSSALAGKAPPVESLGLVETPLPPRPAAEVMALHPEAVTCRVAWTLPREGQAAAVVQDGCPDDLRPEVQEVAGRWVFGAVEPLPGADTVQLQVDFVYASGEWTEQPVLPAGVAQPDGKQVIDGKLVVKQTIPELPKDLPADGNAWASSARIFVDVKGYPIRIETRSQIPAYIPLLTTALKTWRYKPYLIEGAAVPYTYVQKVKTVFN